MHAMTFVMIFGLGGGAVVRPGSTTYLGPAPMMSIDYPCGSGHCAVQWTCPRRGRLRSSPAEYPKETHE